MVARGQRSASPPHSVLDSKASGGSMVRSHPEASRKEEKRRKEKRERSGRFTNHRLRRVLYSLLVGQHHRTCQLAACNRRGASAWPRVPTAGIIKPALMGSHYSALQSRGGANGWSGGAPAPPTAVGPMEPLQIFFCSGCTAKRS